MLSHRLVDANLYVPWGEAKNLLSNIGVQLLSDLVRARALANTKAFPCGGWLLDGDTVWLRSPVAAGIGKFGLPKFGHFFGAQHASLGKNCGSDRCFIHRLGCTARTSGGRMPGGPRGRGGN